MPRVQPQPEEPLGNDDEVPSLMCSSPIPQAPLVHQFRALTVQYCRAIRHIRRFTIVLRRLTFGTLVDLNSDDQLQNQVADFERMENELRTEFRRAKQASETWLRNEAAGTIDDDDLNRLEDETHVLMEKLVSAHRKLAQRDELVRAIVQYYNLN